MGGITKRSTSWQDQGGVVLKEDPFKKLLEANLGFLKKNMCVSENWE
jgi:hypothetical protein